MANPEIKNRLENKSALNDDYLREIYHRYPQMTKIIKENSEEYLVIGTEKNENYLIINQFGDMVQTNSTGNLSINENLSSDITLDPEHSFAWGEILDPENDIFVARCVDRRKIFYGNVKKLLENSDQINKLGIVPFSFSNLSLKIEFEELIKNMAIENGTLNPEDNMSNGNGFY